MSESATLGIFSKVFIVFFIRPNPPIITPIPTSRSPTSTTALQTIPSVGPSSHPAGKDSSPGLGFHRSAESFPNVSYEIHDP